MAHFHVRDPKTEEPAGELALYREVTQLIRAADVDLVLDLTAGMINALTRQVMSPLKPLFVGIQPECCLPGLTITDI